MPLHPPCHVTSRLVFRPVLEELDTNLQDVDWSMTLGLSRTIRGVDQGNLLCIYDVLLSGRTLMGYPPLSRLQSKRFSNLTTQFDISEPDGNSGLHPFLYRKSECSISSIHYTWQRVAKPRRERKRGIGTAAARHRLGRMSVYFVHFPLLCIHSGIPLLHKNEGDQYVSAWTQ